MCRILSDEWRFLRSGGGEGQKAPGHALIAVVARMTKSAPHATICSAVPCFRTNTGKWVHRMCSQCGQGKVDRRKDIGRAAVMHASNKNRPSRCQNFRSGRHATWEPRNSGIAIRIWNRCLWKSIPLIIAKITK